MERTRNEQIQTDMICPLCFSTVEIGVRKKGYYGHCGRAIDVPDGAVVTAVRGLANGKRRYHYRFPAYIPHCSNPECFLYSANKTFRSVEMAGEAWEDRTSALMGIERRKGEDK